MYLTTIKCWNSLLADGVNFLSPEVFENVFQKYVHFTVCVIEKTELEYCSGFYLTSFFSVFLLSFFSQFTIIVNM